MSTLRRPSLGRIGCEGAATEFQAAALNAAQADLEASTSAGLAAGMVGTAPAAAGVAAGAAEALAGPDLTCSVENEHVNRFRA